MNIHSIAAALLLLAASCAPTPGAAETHVVEISNMAFSPSELHVAVGDTVTWINRDLVPHTATADDGAFDSGSLKTGDSWSYVVKDAGETAYSCSFHPAMTGHIIAR
ncbi:MAG: cupredoxin family copper-binding protein [Pseudomonadota bacterium]